MKIAVIFTFVLSSSVFAFAKDFQTNELRMHQAPQWLNRIAVEKVTNKIQRKLEWKIRRIDVFWHATADSFSKAQSLGSRPTAVTVKAADKATIHMGPTTTQENFKRVLGHELVHVIFFQKYKGAIPSWLEEGFANHLSRPEAVDYRWLVQQKRPQDVTLMEHPFRDSEVSIKTHYKVSQALVEMLDNKCNLENLIRLSVRKKMTDYIATYCEIKDINVAFNKWLLEKK